MSGIQKQPYVVDAEAGEVWYCRCGQSKNQPYCDGSHATTAHSPIQVPIEEAKRIAFCGCRQSSNMPFCDGTHKKL